MVVVAVEEIEFIIHGTRVGTLPAEFFGDAGFADDVGGDADGLPVPRLVLVSLFQLGDNEFEIG